MALGAFSTDTNIVYQAYPASDVLITCFCDFWRVTGLISISSMMQEPYNGQRKAKAGSPFSFSQPLPEGLIIRTAQSPFEEEPEITINTRVGGSVAENLYEIELRVMVTCETNLKIQFIAEVTYAGLFEVNSADEDQMAHFIYIVAPELLFVHAQRVIMDMARDGGFRRCLLPHQTSSRHGG